MPILIVTVSYRYPNTPVLGMPISLMSILIVTLAYRYPNTPVLGMQIAAWDANVVTAHRRLGNTGLSLKDLSDGMTLNPNFLSGQK